MTAKYKIADKLCHVADHSLHLFVTSTLTEECPGGVQYHYYCRTFEQGGFSNVLLRFNEVELCKIPPKTTVLNLMRQLKGAAIAAGELELASLIRDSEKIQEARNETNEHN